VCSTPEGDLSEGTLHTRRATVNAESCSTPEGDLSEGTMLNTAYPIATNVLNARGRFI